MRSAASLAAALLLVVPATAQAPRAPSDYDRAVAAGYKAAMLCSGIFNAGRTEQQIARDELAGIYADYAGIVPTLQAKIDRTTATVSVAYSDSMPPRRAVWHRGTGCTNEPIGAAPPPAVDSYRVPPAPAPALPGRWPAGDDMGALNPPKLLADTVARAFDAASYGKGSKTVSVLILRDGKPLAERYAEGFGPFTPNRTWSVAKSITGTLAGIAVGQGLADTARPARIPQWQDESGMNARRRITLDNLLRMASGLHSDTAGNRTDAIYFGGTAVTEETVSWPLEARPGTRFRYANNDILLAMLSLRTAMGDAAYRDFPERTLFGPLGMRHTTAETDWRGNYVLSSQVWSTARDLARLGQLWLDDGVWQGKRILPTGWVRYMTTPSGPQPTDGRSYGATLWLFTLKDGLPAGSYSAQGNRGQYVVVIPSRRLVLVRRGEDGGSARFDIARFTADVIGAIR